MNKTDREKVFRLLRAASRFESRLNKRATQMHHGYVIRNYLWIFQAIPFSIAVALAVSRKFFGAPEIFGIAGLVILLLSYFATLIQPFLLAWVNRRELVAAVRNPIGLLLQNANVTATVDARVIPRLLQNPIENLELLVLELKAEKDFFEKRISLVVGAIEKIGLGPGLLAAGVSLSNIKIDQSNWVSAIAYAIPVLYIFSVAGHFLLMRLDRFVKLTELVVSRKKSLTTA